MQTTTVYADIDLKTKAKAIAACDSSALSLSPEWQKDADLMAFLRSL